ncbi:MAG: hypothetical protein WC340_10425 [Kiritimatiellia bacterium]
MTVGIFVDTLELDKNLILSGLHTVGQRPGSDRRTLGNRLAPQRGASGGGELTLTSTLSGSRLFGRWTRAQIDQLRTWANDGETHTLTVHDASWTVVLLIDGIATAQLFPRSNPQETDIYTGSVTFAVTD